tara:strand:- start:7535 stop:8023 length:489 start_codon:yes stop_codon:yes gene_type:complete
MPLPFIYCDMDGVLADFKRGAEKATGVPINKWMSLTKADKWNPIKNDKRFWEDLPWMRDGKQLWNFISKYKPALLSAYTDRDPNCKPGKMKWAAKNLGLGTNRVNLVMRSQKQNYAQTGYRSPAVLIDDYPANVQQFRARGGIGIVHTTASKTIAELKKLGY